MNLAMKKVMASKQWYSTPGIRDILRKDVEVGSRRLSSGSIK